MGFISTVKSWLNIGGVSVKITGANEQISVGQHDAKGVAVLTTKSDKQVLSVVCQVVDEHTYKKDEETKTDRNVLGEQRFTEGFEIKTGETREIPFSFSYFLKEKMRHGGGMLGTAAKFGAFASGDTNEYYLIVTADVKGTPLDPSAKVKLKIV